jgi:hypothetical protein
MLKVIKPAPDPGLASTLTREFLDQVAERAGTILWQEARRSYHNPQRTVSDPTGQLVSSIVKEGPTWLGPGAVQVKARTDLFYAPFVETGTGLYGPFASWITPRSARVMRWTTFTARAADLAAQLGFPSGPGWGTFYLHRVRGQQGWHAFQKAIESQPLAVSLKALDNLPTVIYRYLTSVR